MTRYTIIALYFAVTLTTPVLSKPDSVIVGVEIFSISDIRAKDDRFTIDFQLWFKGKNDTLDMFNTITLMNAKSFNKGLVKKEKVGDTYWSTAKCNAEIYCDWNLSHFPFIAQNVNIDIIESFYDSRNLVIIADTVNSKISKSFVLVDWEISSFSFKSDIIKSSSNFGNPSSANYNFSAGVLSFTLERKNPNLMIEKLLLPIWISFLVCLVVFWIKPTNVDPRFGLSIGALFAAVANKYIISEVTIALPYQTYIEKVHNHTFVIMLMIIIISVISLHYCENEKPVYKKIDKISFYLVLAAYLIDNILLFISAYR